MNNSTPPVKGFPYCTSDPAITNVDLEYTIPASAWAKGANRLSRRIFHSGPAVTYNARPVAWNVRPVPQVMPEAELSGWQYAAGPGVNRSE